MDVDELDARMEKERFTRKWGGEKGKENGSAKENNITKTCKWHNL
jgi:hypothetical protein